MIDLRTERLITLTEAAKILPRKPCVATLWRWRNAGVRGRRLESVVVGGRIYTSAEALQRFALASGSPAPAPRDTTHAREKRQRAVERELQAAGL